ncbi:molybdenum cofactor biosynthesis protein MoaE [bacterium]|nr:molybdenum cofactor biosynthesis protein MoaE [bacterium]
MEDFVAITTGTLSLDAVVEAIGHQALAEAPPGSDREAGALVTFSGIVRETEGDRKIPSLQYEHYPRMAEKEMGRLVERAREKWELRRVAMVHRVGEVPVGESSIVVAVSAGHRPEAFEAARFLIDELKKSVPIWKKALASD